LIRIVFAVLPIVVMPDGVLYVRRDAEDAFRHVVAVFRVEEDGFAFLGGKFGRLVEDGERR